MKHSPTSFRMIAKTFAGLEDVLAAELLTLGAQKVQAQIRSVYFYGDTGFLYKANLALATALRILKPVAFFKVRNEKELYRKLYDLDWPAMFSGSSSILVDAVVSGGHFKNSHYIELRTKDAIVDKFRDTEGGRPDVDKNDPDIRIHIHINRENVEVALDSSGDPLFKRGYRTDTGKAPLNEVLAAGLIRLSGWNGKSDFLDPMCGSGTIPIEAAYFALKIPPQINRTSFSFINWPDFDPELYNTIRDGLIGRAREPECKIMGADASSSAVNSARINVKNAGLEDFIRIQKGDFLHPESDLTADFMIFNPPYGERLAISDPEFYKKIGDSLKQNHTDCTAWIFTGDFEGLKQLGLRTSRRIPLVNGAIECRFVCYEMYSGTRKNK